MITETMAKSFVPGTSFTLRLPKYVSWHSDTVTVPANIAVSPHANITATGKINPSDDRELTISLGGGVTSAPAYIYITPVVNVDSDFPGGNIEVTLRNYSTSGISSTWVNDSSAIAAALDYTLEVSAKDEKEVVAGRLDMELGTIVIKEAAPGVLLERNIELKLPKGVAICDSDDDGSAADETSAIEFKRVTGNIDVTANPTISKKGDKITFTVNKESTSRSTLEFRFKHLDIAGDFSGDIVVDITGRAGAEGRVVIGAVVPPLKASVGKTDVKIGFQNQAVSDIILTEAQAEALREGNLTITAPRGVTFHSVPRVTVTEGNLDVDDKVSIDTGKTSVTIDIDAESTKASTIKISQVVIDVDRTVPVGPIVFELGGKPVTESNANDAADFDVNTVLYITAANCVTPASDSAALVSQFVIGSSAYTLNGTEYQLPVAPYIEDSRTKLPVRYVAIALGVPEQNILWDGEARTVTLIKDGVVVQLTIGSKSMILGAATITLDTAPTINNNYTFLPISVIAQAFGYSADWDAATQTVSIYPLGAASPAIESLPAPAPAEAEAGKVK
jgi:hypothetical protein